MRIEPLTSDQFDAFATFARGTPPLQMCWCQFWRLRSKDFGAAKVPELRERLRSQAEAAAATAEAPDDGAPEPPGLVAFDDDGRAVGWVSLGPRDAYARITHSKVIPKIDDRPVWSIVCFAVSATARGRGVARALLEAAIDFATVRGAEALEGYPVAIDDGEPIHPDSAFTGTVPMFEPAGFEIVADRASDPSSKHTRVVVRRELGATR